jgi:enoyl-CoA hydratase/carnithine racemase
MAYEGYESLKIRVERGVAFVTIDNPPINLLTQEMTSELLRLAGEIAADPAVKVTVFDSANPDFFIAHYDVTALSMAADFLAGQTPPPRTELHELNQAAETFRRMPKVSIAKLEGRARGGGSEFVLGLDMRFGAIGKALLGQPEVALGIIPGGGGTQRLPRLMGQARALEIVLGCNDFTAEVAERYGYINRALPPEELGPFVEDLAYQIASFPAEAIALGKKSVQNVEEMSIVEGLHEETVLFGRSLATEPARVRMKRFLEVGGQTREGELDLMRLAGELAEAGAD